MAWRRQWPLGGAATGSDPSPLRGHATHDLPEHQPTGTHVTLERCECLNIFPRRSGKIAARAPPQCRHAEQCRERACVQCRASLARTLGWDRVNPDVGFTTTWPVVGSTPSEDGSGDLIAYLALIAAGARLLVSSVRNIIKTPRQGFLLFALSGPASLVLILVMLKWQPWALVFS